jgi:hypothetical protein
LVGFRAAWFTAASPTSLSVPVALVVGDDLATVVPPHGNARVGRTEVDADRRTVALRGGRHLPSRGVCGVRKCVGVVCEDVNTLIIRVYRYIGKVHAKLKKKLKLIKAKHNSR